jgi:C4-dicarboxylate-specific signal transduction histidine kinase
MPAHAQLLQTQEGRVRDIAMPMLEGEAGVARVGISERRTENVLGKVRQRFLAFAAAALILGMLMAAAGARLITQPIRSVAAAASAVAAGDWSQQVVARGEDEVAMLGRAFNTMLAQLRESRVRLEEDAANLARELRQRQLLQQQLIQSGKLAAIGTLAAGIAHELNQPLTAVRAQVQELLSSGSVGGDDEAMLHDVEGQTTRMMQIIEHLRTFSRESLTEKALIPVNKVVTRALGMVGQQLRSRGIEVRLDLAPEAGEIEANATQVEQVLLNLLTNARDALDGRGGGVIRMSTQRAAGGEGTGAGVLIEVSDNGPGIPAELRDRLFEPFFTTKPVGRGTGLGLSVSHGIVTDHGGRIQLAANTVCGATFRVWLPYGAAAERIGKANSGHG